MDEQRLPIDSVERNMKTRKEVFGCQLQRTGLFKIGAMGILASSLTVTRNPF